MRTATNRTKAAAPARSERVTLGRTVRDQILDLIRRGQVRPGERLPGEHELAKMFGVGRSSVREGLQPLVQIGLLEPRPGRGYLVNGEDGAMLETNELTPAILQEAAAVELAEARQWLEVTMGEMAVRRATEADFRRMERALNRLRRAAALGQPVYRASADFHVALAAAAHNRVLFTLMRSLRSLLKEGGRATEQVTGHSAREVERHEALYAALQSRDPERVRHEILHHLTDSLRDFQSSSTPKHLLPA